jgi:hypothetical protein
MKHFSLKGEYLVRVSESVSEYRAIIVEGDGIFDDGVNVVSKLEVLPNLEIFASQKRRAINSRQRQVGDQPTSPRACLCPRRSNVNNS